jgi:hypothetical protein
MAVSSDPLAPGNEGLIARDRGLLNFPEPEAAREAVRRIDLSGNKIRSFPNWLAELVALRELGLDENLDLRWNRLVGADEMIREWKRGGCLVYRCPPDRLSGFNAIFGSVPFERLDRAVSAGVGDDGEFIEKTLPAFLGKGFQQLGLNVNGDVSEFFVFLLAAGFELDAVGAAIAFVTAALHPARLFHALQQGRDGVGIAAHHIRELALSDAFGVAFQQAAHRGKLIWRCSSVRNVTAESLIQTIPGAPQEGRQSPSVRGVDGKIIGLR